MESSFFSRLNVYILFPIQMNYFLNNQTKEEDEQDLEDFCRLMKINMESLSSSVDMKGRSIFSELKDSLKLSENARKFAQFWMFETATYPFDPYVNLPLFAGLPYGLYRLLDWYKAGRHGVTTVSKEFMYSQIRKSYKLQSFAALILGYIVAYSAFRYLDEAKYEFALSNFIENISETEPQRGQELLAGAKEYFIKTQKIEKIVEQYSRYKTQQNLFSQFFASRFNLDSVISQVDKKLHQK